MMSSQLERCTPRALPQLQQGRSGIAVSDCGTLGTSFNLSECDSGLLIDRPILRQLASKAMRMDGKHIAYPGRLGEWHEDVYQNGTTDTVRAADR